MKKTKIVCVLIFLLVILLGCSKKDDLPYALSAEQYRIIYVVPEQGNVDQLQWFQEFEDKHKGVILIAFSLELTQKEFPSLDATEVPYIYVLSQNAIVIEGSDMEEVKKFLIENTN
ncbi:MULTISPECIES: hypothetical protein [Bacillus]|uniref:hypothetical protein n=1 Tax=Bacillus TaxID=1386 RepID=UPI000BB82DE4|nr:MULTISPECIES: hypothetical protein [Bacillus]